MTELNNDGVNAQLRSGQAAGTADAIVEVPFRDKRFRFSHSDPGDNVFRILQGGKFYKTEFLAAALSHIPAKSLVIDVGANIGNHTAFFAGVTGASVVAFESDPEAFRLLSKNVRANHLEEQISCLRLGIDAKSQSGSMRNAHPHNLGTASIVPEGGPVSITTLDAFRIPRRPSLIKIDTEGMNFEVLLGARRTIFRYRPTVCIEAKHYFDYF